MKSGKLAAIVLTVMVGAGVTSGNADEYFSGKTITLFAGYPPGGGVDNEMRTIARFYGSHIPGNPNIIAKNMPGAGGLVLGNYLYNVGPKDGTELGMPGRSGFLLANSIGHKGAKYTLSEFTYVGSTATTNSILWLRSDLGIKDLEDLKKAKKEIVLGGLSSRSQNIVVPKVLAKYQGFPFKLVHGYPGFRAVLLAMERNEVDGLFSHEGSIQATRPDLITNNKVVAIYQTFPIEPNIPTMDSFVTDPDAKALMTLLNAPSRIGLPILGPPGMDEAATAALREGHQKMVKDKEFLKLAADKGLHVNPSTGPELQEYIEKNLVAVPEKVVQEYLEYTKRKKKK